MDVVNLDPEKFEYKQIKIPLEDGVLVYQHTNAAMRTRSRIYEGFESCFILGPDSRGSFDGLELQPYSMIAAGPGAQAELVLESDFDGSLVDLYLGVDYQIFGSMAVGLGFNSVAMDIGITKENFNGNFDWQYDGGLIFLKFDF